MSDNIMTLAEAVAELRAAIEGHPDDAAAAAAIAAGDHMTAYQVVLCRRARRIAGRLRAAADAAGRAAEDAAGALEGWRPEVQDALGTTVWVRPAYRPDGSPASVSASALPGDSAEYRRAYRAAYRRLRDRLAEPERALLAWWLRPRTGAPRGLAAWFAARLYCGCWPRWSDDPGPHPCARLACPVCGDVHGAWPDVTD